MKKIVCSIMSVIIFLSLFGCSSEETDNTVSRDYMAMDTVFSIQMGKVAENSEKSETELFDQCEKLTADIENVLSATAEGSELSNLNQSINVMFDADPVLIEVLSTAKNISELTDGTYDPTIGALTSLWNVKGGGPVPAEDKIASALNFTGIEKIEIDTDSVKKSDPEVKLDLGGIGKGYAAQKIVEYLHESGVPYGIISAGRTVGVFGTKPDGESFKIGIADPFDPDGIVGFLYTNSGFISVAGDYEQYFEEDGVVYHHIIDPTTGYPSDSGLTSVAVFSQNGAIADALSTALMVMGYERGMEFCNSSKLSFEAVFICKDGSVKKTDGLTSDRFEIAESYKSTSITTASSTIHPAENKD